MSWVNLTEDIEEMFARFEGVLDITDQPFGFSIIESVEDHNARGRAANMSPDVLERKRQRSRESNMTTEQVARKRESKRVYRAAKKAAK